MTDKLTVSIAARLEPIGRYANEDGDPLAGTDIKQYADNLTGYLAKNLEAFADARGGDVFVHVVVARGDETAGGEYRSGHFVKDENDEPTKD